MGIKTAAIPRHEIPLQKDGRSELQELAAALSKQAEQRHRDLGTYPVEPVATQQIHFDLTAAPEPAPQPRAPEPRSTLVKRAVPLVAAAILTAAVSATAWSATHPSAAKTPATATQTQAAPSLPQSAPVTPADFGRAAHQRLTQGGRPATVFACEGAYAADAAISNGVLPPATTSPDTWRAYLATCLSDMSDTNVGRSG